MGWSIGFDNNWNRDIGYGVVAYCDHPECNKVIDRGLAYVCAGEEPRGGDGCGLYFCGKHLSHWIMPEATEDEKQDEEYDPEPLAMSACERCGNGEDPFAAKPEHPHWAWWKMNAGSWSKWRSDLSPIERRTWKKMAAQYTPTKDDIEEAKEDE